MRFEKEAVRMEEVIGSDMTCEGVLTSPNITERENRDIGLFLTVGLFDNLNHGPSGIQRIFLKRGHSYIRANIWVYYK